jgi:hypothetical protein
MGYDNSLQARGGTIRKIRTDLAGRARPMLDLVFTRWRQGTKNPMIRKERERKAVVKKKVYQYCTYRERGTDHEEGMTTWMYNFGIRRETTAWAQNCADQG